VPKIPFLYPSFLELRNCEGNVSKQLAQGCHPMEQWQNPGPEYKFQVC